VDTHRFSPRHRDDSLVRKRRAGASDRATIFFPHRLCEEKGLGQLLEAYRLLQQRLPHAPALVIAGTGPEQSRVEEAARQHRHVHYLGYLRSRRELARQYASADLAGALSPFETFGLSTAEAMARGLAVVSADEGAAAELVRDSGGGLTVPYGDAAQLARALESLITEGGLRRRGAAGRAHVRRYCWKSCFDNELRHYRELVDLHRRGARLAPGLHEQPGRAPAPVYPPALHGLLAVGS
jgi:alpha-1,6-mannosyltransferase